MTSTTVHNSRVKQIAAAAFWILAWQAGAVLVNRHLLIPVPTPYRTAAALIRLMADRGFFHAVFFSILRIAAGFALAFAAGTAMAVLCVKSEFLHTLFQPLLGLIRAIPVASFTILVFLWVSREKIPSTITFFTVLPVIWANVESGLRAADKGLVEMARVFGLPGRRILREILLPSIRPYISSAAGSGIGFAWKSGVAAEVICRTQDSLGNLLWAGKSSVAYDEVFAVTLVIVALSIILQKITERLLHLAKDRREAVSVTAAGENAAAPDAGPSAVPVPAEMAGAEMPAVSEDVPGRERFVIFDAVSFSYGMQKPVFSNLSLSLRNNDRVCLQGKSGSGKTTFLRISMGLAKPKGGTFRAAEPFSVSAVFQEDRLIPWKTVLENVLFFAGSEAGEEKNHAARALLSEAGLAGSEDMFPDELSGGMKRRAAIVRALMHPSDLLVLDEAFTGLDHETKRRCMEMVSRCASDRMVLMASHDPWEAEALGAEIFSL